jgi:hypothetical protein
VSRRWRRRRGKGATGQRFLQQGKVRSLSRVFVLHLRARRDLTRRIGQDLPSRSPRGRSSGIDGTSTCHTTFSSFSPHSSPTVEERATRAYPNQSARIDPTRVRSHNNKAVRYNSSRGLVSFANHVWGDSSPGSRLYTSVANERWCRTRQPTCMVAFRGPEDEGQRGYLISGAHGP